MSRSTGSVALISHSNSGISHYTYSLADALSNSKDIDVHFLTNSAFDCDFKPNIKVAPLFGRSRWLPFQLIKVFSYIFVNHIRILHFQSVVKYPLLTLLIIIFMKLSGRTIIFTAHDIMPHYARRHHKIIMSWIYKLSDGVIVHSKNNIEMIDALVPGIKRLTIIPHGLYEIFSPSENITKPEARDRLNLPHNKKVILFFGRIDKRKGAEALIEQMPALINRMPDLLVLMVGRSAYEPGYLEQLGADLGVSRHLNILNAWVADADVCTYFIASDAVILPYLEGSTSGVIKIALATGTPVVATDVGELREIVEETGCGVIVGMPFTNEDITSIEGVISPGMHALPQSADGKDWLSDLSWDSIAIKTLEFYKGVINA